MNKVILMGRLTRDAEISRKEGGVPMARFTFAVNRNFHKEGQQEADFISCKAFGKRAEFLEKFGKQGIKFVIDGNLQTGSYEKNGQKINTVDVVVDNIEFAESRKTDSAPAPAQAPAQTPAPTQSQPAQAASAPAQDPWADANGFMNIPDGVDDILPFN